MGVLSSAVFFLAEPWAAYAKQWRSLCDRASVPQDGEMAGETEQER